MIGPGRAFARAFVATGGALLALLTVKGGLTLAIVSALWFVGHVWPSTWFVGHVSGFVTINARCWPQVAHKPVCRPCSAVCGRQRGLSVMFGVL